MANTKKSAKNKRANPPAPTAPATARNGGRRAPKMTLMFPPGPIEGLTNAATSQFSGKNPASCIRELIQNSLDAALVDLKKTKAIIRFSIQELLHTDIPGIDDHRRAEQAIAVAGNANKQTQNVREELQQGYSQTDALFVTDNGVGLDAPRLAAMLSDGKSHKGSEGASGSWGNGHLTTFALSRLRYLFYGGVSLGGHTTFAGHAILASHSGKYKGKKTACGKNGYYVKDLNDAKLDEGRFTFGDEKSIPAVFRPQMEAIRQHGSGTMIVVPAFNHFGMSKNKTADIIRSAAAMHFFPAVHDGQLEIEVAQNGETYPLTRAHLQPLIDAQKEGRRGRHGFPSGRRISHAFQTLQQGEPHVITTSYGKIRAFIRTEEAGEKRVSLCRNGMWISDDISKLRPSDFADRVNFNALLLVDAKSSGRAHTLLKVAETPLHNEIAVKNIGNKAEQQALLHLLGEIQQGIKDLVAKRSDEEYSPADFFPIEIAETAKGRSGSQGRIETIGARPSRPDKTTGKKPKEKPRAFRPNSAIPAKISSRRVGNQLSLVLQAEHDCDSVELGLTLDEGKDATCADSGGRDIARIQKVTVERPQDVEAKVVSDDNNIPCAIKLSPWRQGEKYHLVVEYTPPANVAGDYALIVNLAKSKTSTTTAKNVDGGQNA